MASLHIPHPALQSWLDDAPATRGAAFLREPAHDDDQRECSDLDLLVFDHDLDEMLVQRVTPDAGPTLDLLRLPGALLAQPERLAGMGLITHRLLTARPVFDRDGDGGRVRRQVRALAGTASARESRIASFLELGALTVREVGVTADWPALARFWLHMAHAAALAALLDAHGEWCPNVYTRPHAAARRADALLGRAVRAPMDEVLGLANDWSAAADALRALHREVRSRCPEPAWPQAMPQATRWEYRYWSARAELDERLDAAAALAARGDSAAAAFYLRYAAYSTLRIAMLHQRALEAWPRAIPFLRPETEVRPDLDAHHPGLVPLADAVFGAATRADVDDALEATLALHARVIDAIAGMGIALPAQRPWRPFVAAPHRRDRGR